MKKCNGCDTDKDESEFYKNGKYLSSKCKVCDAKIDRVRYQKNKLNRKVEYYPDYLCACGCSSIMHIKIIPEHIHRGKPKFIKGHINKVTSKYPPLDYSIKKFCECGCGKQIIILPQHRWEGIPKYIVNHKKTNYPFDYTKTYYCHCGCGQPIKFNRNHRYKGVPKYIKGHYAKKERHPAWKGGITPLHKQIRDSKEYKRWTKEVLRLGEYTCQDCGDRNGQGYAVYLEAHHLNPLSKIVKVNHITTLAEAVACIELWNINNGLCVCKKCHKKRHMKTKNKL